MTGEDNTRFSPFKEFNTSVSDWFTNFSLVDLKNLSLVNQVLDS